jgi:hypothetical protein
MPRRLIFYNTLKYSEIFKLYPTLKGEACRSFCHGNISNNIVLERLGIEVIKFSNKFNKEFIPKLASSFIRWRFNLNKDSFLFMGHLHYLNKIGNDVFCGTFKLNSLLYERNESLGFVRIITNHNFIVKEINLVHI